MIRPGRCALQRVDHDQQLHQVLIHRKTGRLHDKNIDAADVLEQLKVDLSIGKTLQLAFAQMNTDMGTNILSQFAVG